MREFSKMIREHLDVGHELLYLSRDDVKSLNIPKETLYEKVREALTMYSNKETHMPAKAHIFPDENCCYISMPGMIPEVGSVGHKWVGAYNNNMKDYGLPSLCAHIIVSDPETGWPIAFMDGVHIMETRTPAIATIIARELARKDSEVFGMIGLGREGRNHFPVMPDALPNLKKILVWDVNPAAMDKAIEDFQDIVPVPMEKAESLEYIVRNSDVLASATFFKINPPKPPIPKEWIPKGQTIIVTDLHTQFDPAIIRECDLYVTDSQAQQAGLVEEGYFYEEIRVPDCEVGDIFAGRHKGRVSNDDIIVANPAGMAIDDFAVTPLVIEATLKKGIGVKLPL